MGKYRLVNLNVVKYTDNEVEMDELLNAGFVLEPVMDADETPDKKTGGKKTADK